MYAFFQKTRNVGLSGQELMFQQHRGLISSGPGEDCGNERCREVRSPLWGPCGLWLVSQ